MSALPAKEFTTRQVLGVQFGFYTDEEASAHRCGSACLNSSLRMMMMRM